MCLPYPGRAEEQAVGGVIEPAIVIGQLHQGSRVEGRAVLKLKVGQTFYGGELRFLFDTL